MCKSRVLFFLLFKSIYRCIFIFSLCSCVNIQEADNSINKISQEVKNKRVQQNNEHPEDKLFSADLYNMPIGLFIKFLHKQMNTNYMLISNKNKFNKKIDINFQDYTYQNILSHLAHNYNIGYDIQNGAHRFFEDDYQIKSIEIPTIKKETLFLTNALKDDNININTKTNKEEDFWEPFEKSIKNIMSIDQCPNEFFIFNKSLGTLTIGSSPKKIEKVQDYINSVLEEMDKYFLVEIDFLSVQKNDSKKLDIDWSVLYNNDSSRSLTPNMNISKQGELSLYDFTSYYDFKTIIKRLSIKYNVLHLYNAKLITSNKHYGIFKIGDYKKFFQGNKSTIGHQSNSPSISTDLSLEKKFSGFLMSVSLSARQNNKVSVNLSLSLNSISNENISMVLNDQPTSVPSYIDRIAHLSTAITIGDGNSIVLGGLNLKKIFSRQSNNFILGDVFGLKNEEANHENSEELIVLSIKRL